MLPRKFNIFCTLVLFVACAIEDSATQVASDRFHQLPTSCYHCSDGDCATSYPGRLLKCTSAIDEACATAFAANGTVVARGCRDTVAETCQSENCLYCQSTGCNIAQSLTDYVDCIDCDTATNPNCLYDPSQITVTRKCYQSCMTTLYERKNTSSNPAYELARTCLDDYDLDDRESCGGQNENCVSCATGSCNTVKLPAAARKICFICQGEDCEDPQSLECPAYRSIDQCFTEFDAQNDISRMGCASSLDDDYIASRKRNIYLCDDDNCNLYSAQAYDCASCSSQDDTNCVNALTGTIKTCSIYPYTQCASYLTETGELVRDCVYNVPGDDLFDACLSSNNSVCQTCSGNSCNKAVFPEDRRSCLQCDASVDANCDVGSTEYASYCNLYQTNDNCVISVIDGLTRRGCQSDFTCDSTDAGSCRICSDNNCNTANLVQNNIGEPGRFQDLPLSCYNCEGASCAAGLGESQTCSNNNLQNCFTVFDAENAVSRRGCSDVVLANYSNYCDQNADKCFNCKSNNCNNAVAITEFIDCYFCDSANRQNCAVNFIGSRTRKCKSACMTILYPSSLETNPTYETLRSCLDDLETTQQTSCSLNENQFCSACTSNNCNDNELPANRLECFKCLDESCQNRASSKCDTYASDDQCFVLFDPYRNVTNLGCRSAIPPDTVEVLIKQQQLWVCDGNNCNDVTNLPIAKSCLVCNSASDVRCASNPSALSTYQSCAAKPYTECVTRITATGATERGCLSTLQDDTFYNCFKGTDALCATCSADNCNADNIFPTDRLQCHQCNSATNAACTDAPNSVAVCPVYAADDTCVSTIKNTYTVRGCSSSLACDNNNDTASCRKCSTAGCNTVNLEKNFAQGEPGKWQSLPISCYTCNDTTSCATLDNAVQCTVNINQHCLTVFNSDGVVTQRGCSDNVLADQAEYCDTNPDNCLGCNSNNCNIANSKTDYIDCWFCDTERDGSCVYDLANLNTTRKCYRQCMSALYARTNETNPAYGLSRSCLDDLELLDRAECANGNKENCVACSTSQCNTAAIPATRLSCYQCQNEDCAAPTAQQCAQYRANDVCYTQYDETQAITRLGCRSDYEEQEAEYLVSQKRVLYCTGDNCNSLTAVPASQVCTLCNSRTDTNCASSPADVVSRTTCAKLPYTECYTRVLDDGATERGCLSNLEDDQFYQCLMGTSNETCKTCTGSRCNSELFPVPRIACHICDSRTSAECENSPNSLAVCPIYDAAQTCISTVRDGVTYRGCSKQLVCDSLDTKGCQICSEDGCNTENLSNKIDNNFGKWQDLPLTCWDCSGENCTSNTLTEKQCSNNLEQDCLTVFDANNNVVRRGCADEVNAEYAEWCSQNSNLCLNCKSNKCNTATSLSSYINCVSCDSYYNSDCLYNVSAVTTRRSCEGSCMTALYPAIVSSKPSYELIRSCLNDKESSDQTTCSSGRDTLCSACSTDSCNTVMLPPTRLSCYQCFDENCDEPVSKYCPRYAEDDECFILFDDTNSVMEMGCISSINIDEEELVGTKRIYKCSGDNCNSLSNIPAAHQCVSCDSTNNSLCATNAYAVITINTCAALPYTSCYTRIDESGATQRGCASDLESSTFTNCVLNKDDKCQVCDGDGCNREIFPADRLSCYTCEGASDQTCDAAPGESEVCAIYAADTSCVTALMGGNVTVRGCNSDILCDATDKSSCRSCTKSNCNSIKLLGKEDDGYHGVWQSLPLTCYACEGEQCAYSLGVSSSCAVNIEQDCMTVFETNGTVRRRGCSDDVEDYEDLYCRQNPRLCYKCKSNDCNIAWQVSDYIECDFCDSATNAECATHPENTAFSSRFCYKQCMVASKDNTIIRSCLDDKEAFNQTTCLSTNSKECASCTFDNCNNFVFPRPAVSCHVCADAACTTSVSQQCNFSEEGDNFCFAKYENNVPAILGCGNSESAENLEQWISEKTAYICDTDNCNALSELPTAISCVSCNSTASCAQTPDQVLQYDTCSPLIDQCYSLISNDGKTARGCVSNLPYETEYSCVRDGTCEICESNRCNNQIYPANRRKCYICDAAKNPSCAEQLSSGLSQVCPIFEPADACVSTVVNGNVVRGCASELTCNENDPSNCVLCGDDNCNTAQFSTTTKPTDPPSGGTTEGSGGGTTEGSGGGTTEGSGGGTTEGPTDKTTENPEDSAASLNTSSLLSLLLCYAITLVLKWH